MGITLDWIHQNTRNLLDGLNTAVFVFDNDLRLVYINAAGEMLMDNSASHCIGLDIDGLVVDSDYMQKHLRQALQTGQPYMQRGCRLQPNGRDTVTVDCTGIPLYLDGEIQGLLVEMLQVDRQLRINLETHLLDQQQATRSLVRGLAHEIKNPLGGLRGAAQLLEQEITDEYLKEYTRIIIGEADRLQNLVNRMLGPNNVPRMRSVNIHEVLAHVCSLVQAENLPGLVMKQDYDPSIPELWADRDLLVQAVLNIVRNAVQALQGKGLVYLRTRTLRQYTIGNQRYRHVVKVEILDNGPGIPKEILKQIFLPMITTNPEGTGLGLSIAQSILNQHKGLIECQSEPGNTKFTLLLPLESEHE